MWDHNPDGGGVAWIDPRHGLRIRRGIMRKDEWIDTTHAPMTRGWAVVSHARISSVGGVRPALTHPWPIYDGGDRDRIVGVLAHNGHIGSWRKDATSDPTIELADPAMPFDFLADPDKIADEQTAASPRDQYHFTMADHDDALIGWLGKHAEQTTARLPRGPWSDTRWIAHAAGHYGIDRILTDKDLILGQRFAVLMPDGTIRRAGYWEEISDGVHVSNTFYEMTARFEWSRGKGGTVTARLVKPSVPVSKAAKRRARRKAHVEIARQINNRRK
jgi:hypothetical protein